MGLRKIYKDPKHRIDLPLLIAEHYPLAHSCNSLCLCTALCETVACHFSSVRWPTGLVFILYQYIQEMCMSGEGAKATDFVYSFIYLGMYSIMKDAKDQWAEELKCCSELGALWKKRWHMVEWI